ncbi:uncharacterized protein PAC_03595 [Phialocephala subalpina]|uniref:Bacteriophage T5 Orf172 DNA-binding domain-containing protein n=1 Tax=Phialocephala subalpina TaxID=576137 RepID=A0A1L7WLS7_9HELO|nr:uncharacterized protein PAC_03595 [Phialocephala subalpina]
MSTNPPQTRAEAVASSCSPNILILRVHHNKASFTATFRTRFTTGSTHETKCSCSRIHHVWLGADDTDDASRRTVLLPEIPQKTTNMTFIYRSAANTQEARDLCASSQTASDTTPFRKRVHELMTALAALCEAEHLSNQTKSWPTASSILRPFRSSNLDRNSVSEELRAKIMTPLAPSEVQGQGLGYIYILRSQLGINTLSALKIGFSKYHPEHRAHELASCLSVPEVVAHTPLIPHAKRIESLIHTELVAKRKVQACGQCGKEHREWFTISHAESREIVTRWSRWVLRQPYLDGKLSNEWRAYLQEQEFGSTNLEATIFELWGDILDNLPTQDTDSTTEEQLAAYMNACYFENLGQTILGPLKGNFSSFHDALRDGRSGQPLEIHDYKRAMEEFISSESKIRTDPGLKPRSEGGSDSSKTYDFDAWKDKVFEEVKAIKNLKTGAISISDPEQGVTESPLGDATLLPVVSLKALRKMDAPARSWIGYNPTHEGFQFLQEAYQRGEWVGNIPQFKLPKAFRKAGITKLSAEAATNVKDIDPSSSTQPTSSRNQPKNCAEAQTNTGDQSGRLRGQTTRFIRSEDGDKWEFSAELNEDFLKQVNEAGELMKTPLGRALLEKEMLRSFKHYGLNFTGGYEADASTSSESSADEMSTDEMSTDEMSIDEMSIDGLEHMQPEVNTQVAGSTGKESANVPTSTSQPNIPPSSGLGISKAETKRWLESI